MDTNYMEVASDSDQSADMPYKQSIEVMLRNLLCQECQRWMAPDEILSCLCRLTCVDCAGGNSECEDCGKGITAEERVVQLHQRLINAFPHPCRYNRHGCPVSVKPNQAHEETCAFKPLKCLGCNNMVLRHELIAHFQATHPDKRVLADNNFDVLRSQFIDCDVTLGDQYIHAKIYCMVQGQWLSINIMKYEINDTLVVLGVEPIFYDEDVTLIVKFDFKLKCYNFQRSIVVGKSNLNCESVSKDIVEDWMNGLSKLNITVRKRRVQ